MWIISGPFDAVRPTTDDPAALKLAYSHSKAKLLKTGKSYTLGRKGKELDIDNPKISKTHAEFIVGAFSEDDVSNPDTAATLSVKNLREKKGQDLNIIRGSEHIPLATKKTLALQDGDKIQLSTTLFLTVHWRSICCLALPSKTKLPVSTSSCASIGIHLVSEPVPQTTHFLTPTYTLSGPSATGLLSACTFVKPEWLAELVRLATLDTVTEETALENECALPPEARFRPAVGPGAPKADAWAPNEARTRMLRGLHFLCAGPVDVDVRHGDGASEVFDPAAGAAAWAGALKRAKKKAGEKLVLLADAGALGHSVWGVFAKEAAKVGCRFVSPATVAKAVALVDTSILTEPAEEPSGRDESPLPDIVPNTYPEEPSNPPDTMAPELEPEAEAAPARRPLRRRAATPSAAPAPPREASPPPADEDMPAPRKLVRRARTAKAPIIGIDDPSIIEDSPPGTPALASRAEPPTPARRPLKRRAGTAAPRAASPALSDTPAEAERPTKRFRALFDESDPDRLAQSQLAAGSADGRGSEMYTALGFDVDALGSVPPGASGSVLPGTSGSVGVSEAAPGPSGVGQTQTQTQTQARPGKVQTQGPRGPALVAVREEEEEGDTQAMPPPKAAAPLRQATRAPSPTPAPAPDEPGPKAEKKEKGAALDTDAAFLQALASRRRGKKAEDAFDREFNNLRIARPDLARDAQADEWAVLAQFGDDMAVRGNFMVVVETDDVFRTDGGARASRARETRPEWEGKPNFKKFKKKMPKERREPIPLFLSEPNDAGMGAAYWPKTTYAELRTQQEAEEAAPPPKARPKPKKRAYTEVDSGAEDAPAPAAKSRRASRQPSSREKPLFIDSDSGKDELDMDVTEDFGAALAGVPEEEDSDAAPPPPKRKAAAPVRKARAPAVVQDDDSDDGVTFKGFGRRK